MMNYLAGAFASEFEARSIWHEYGHDNTIRCHTIVPKGSNEFGFVSEAAAIATAEALNAGVQHTFSLTWRWSDHPMAGPERVWACWNGPIGNPDEQGSVWVLPLIEGQTPPTSADLATADFEEIGNLYMTEQQCRAANERKELDRR